MRDSATQPPAKRRPESRHLEAMIGWQAAGLTSGRPYRHAPCRPVRSPCRGHSRGANRIRHAWRCPRPARRVRACIDRILPGRHASLPSRPAGGASPHRSAAGDGSGAIPRPAWGDRPLLRHLHPRFPTQPTDLRARRTRHRAWRVLWLRPQTKGAPRGAPSVCEWPSLAGLRSPCRPCRRRPAWPEQRSPSSATRRSSHPW